MREFSFSYYESGILTPLERSVYDDIAIEAQKWVGYPSIKHDPERPDLGMDPERGFDCSGFVTFVFKRLGLDIPKAVEPNGVDRFYCNTAFDNYGIAVHLGLQQPGHLIFFSYDGEAPNHMGVVVSKTKFAHAPGEKGTGVEIRDIQESKIVLQGKEPVHYNTNPIGIKRPMLREGRWAAPIVRPIFPG